MDGQRADKMLWEITPFLMTSWCWNHGWNRVYRL